MWRYLIYNIYVALMLAVGALLVLAEDGVGDVTVRDNLYRTVIASQLLLGDDVRVVTMDVVVDADDALDHARYGANIVRHHNDCHLVGEVVE